MKNNKGFSLVELIIVIAIMAVLIGVLAPQYLRYVEKSKKQADISAVSEVYNCLKVAYSDPELQSKLSDANVSISNSGITGVPSAVWADVQKTVGSTVTLTSNTYKNTTFTISITGTSDGWTFVKGGAWSDND